MCWSRVSVMTTISQVYEVLPDDEPNSSKSGQQCLTLTEKLDVLKNLDENTLNAIVEDNLKMKSSKQTP